MLELLELFCEVDETLSGVLDLLEDVRLTLLDYLIKLLLSFELVYFKLSFELLLLFDLFFSRPQVAFKVYQEIRLLNKFESLLELGVFLHQVDDGLVRVLDLLVSNLHVHAVASFLRHRNTIVSR